MLNKNKLTQIARKIVAHAHGSDEVEVLLFVSENGLTRFANSEIHQNMAWDSLGISVRIVREKKVGVAATDSLPFDPDLDTISSSAIAQLVHRAQALADLQRPDPHFVGLPAPKAIPAIRKSLVFSTIQERVAAASTVIARAKEHGITASGICKSAHAAFMVVNSCGTEAYHESTSAELLTVLLGETSTGFSERVGTGVSEINAEDAAEQAVEKVIAGANPRSVEPGEWEVILEPQAVDELLAFYAVYAANGRIYHEQGSYLSGRLGTTIASDQITLHDDPLNPPGFAQPFDYEGYPKQKTVLIEKGVARSVVYDSYLAQRYGAANTGHALPAPNTWGPVPTHLHLLPGKTRYEDMIRSVKKGLLVTRLWYVRMVEPRTLTITGMTRDGVFLIKDGAIVHGVKNLRFNQSIPEALSAVSAVGNESVALSSFEMEMGVHRVPHLQIGRWHFTSATEF